VDSNLPASSNEEGKACEIEEMERVILKGHIDR
jgi:hypothetical protein